MKLLHKFQFLILSLISGILLSVSWPLRGFPFLLFISFIPMLKIEDEIFKNSNKYSLFAILLYTYPGFFLWNLLTTYWILYSTIVGMILAVTLNSLFMSLVFQIYYWCKVVLYKKSLHFSSAGAYFILISLWISFEYLHLNWELSWSWLQLGNAFANAVKFIQWYEFTGVMGGTLWVLLINILFYRLYSYFINKIDLNKKIKLLLATLSIIVIPILISLYMYYSYEEKARPVDVVVVQPNVDPYNEKFVTSAVKLNRKLISIAKKKLDKNVDFIVTPETAIQELLWIDKINSSICINELRKMLRDYAPDAKIIAGASPFKLFQVGEKLSSTARKSPYGDYYDAYNSSLFIDTSLNYQFYHKAKLVPGVERMPYPHIFGFLEKYAIDLGGISGSLGTSPSPVVFFGGKVPVTGLICYESIFGEYVGKFVKKGAELIFIITNDGWWRDTPGHRQHMIYATLRAIETRRSIARSANTGISCFINQRGDIFQPTKFWEEDVIRQKINANDKITFYTKHGDYLARMSVFSVIIIFLLTLLKKLFGKKSGLKERKLYTSK